MENDVIERTINEIKEKKISPHPRWRFLLKDYTFWVFLGLSIILGAVSISTILFLLTDYDWDIYRYLHTNLFGYILISVPYLWIFILILFTIVAYYNFRHTTIGYRYNAHVMVLISILLSFIIGTIFFFVGINSEVHTTFSKWMPFYNNLAFDKRDIWNNADKGLLSGTIVDIKSDGSFLLRDFAGEIWYVVYFSPEDSTKWTVSLGMNVKVLGERGKDNIFYIQDIRPWGEMNFRKKSCAHT